ncbi:serine/threonine-protein kinase [Sphingosinicella terrae]|uniref:serine/threonine-protein kinase n=1 Tax=Sphingosinicella terrae TaxID=2172047 RepID=UPI000E0D3D3A|nr:serine/threonine-protein kinase [Sphingosinicella terrae]
MSDDKDKKAPEEGEERTVFMPSLPDAAPPATPSAGEEPAPPAEPAPEPTPTPEESSPFAEPAPPAAGETPPAGEEASPFAEPDPPAAGEPAPAAEGTSPFAEPAPPPAEPAPPPAEPAAAPPPPADATVVAPAAAADPSATASGGTAAGAAFVPREGARPIKEGDVLNHIFEVKRFLARGGMGEVFEGCNVNTDERVAIKVMLPAMAANEKVVAMFRKEARTLTKLQHEALVSYRVLAQEPQLGVLYIVTEFIEGTELGEVLGKVERTPEELAGLLKRLAGGLAAAHRLGAIHRDMSPDNVLLPAGDVHQAKIIDFGIAKDLDASSATIVGDGFAGKLNYVAPEQLGDFGREVGPWTDVYSLALVILAVAQGKNVNMSGSLVDAIDKRRKGPDLSAVPGSLRGLIEDMLRPDPKERIRSMDEVLARLGGAAAPPPPPPPPPLPGDAVAAPARPAGGGMPKGLLFGGLVLLVLLVAAGIWYMFRDAVSVGPADGNEAANDSGEVADSGDPVARARAAINSALPSVGCTWLDVADVQRSGDGVRVAMRGVAGDSAAAQRELGQALEGANLTGASIDFGDVAPITPAGCAALDTYRQTRASEATHLSVPAPRFEMRMQPPGMPYAGEQAANAVISFNFADSAADFAILGIEPSGVITTLFPDRGAFQQMLEQSRARGGLPITDDGNGRYRLNIDLDHQGWSGIILISGSGPFEADVVAPPIGSRGPSWQQSFLSAAAERNWRVEMVWFESVDRVSGDRAPPPAPTTAPPAQASGGAAGGDKPVE